jgi:penicillin G amidase
MISRKRKTIIGLIFLFISVCIAITIFIYNLISKSLPETTGGIKCEKIIDNVKIYRNDFDIPVITARGDYDLMFAFGYTVAQDRLWQMDIQRRLGQGRLSEVFGDKTIELDALSRTIGFEKIAKKIEIHLSQESKAILQAYADGINEFINTHLDRLPLEFDLLKYEPEKWEIAHSLLIIRLFGWEMNFSWWSDLIMAELADKFGEKKIADIFPSYPSNGLTIYSTGKPPYAEILKSFIKSSEISQNLLGMSALAGSNNWVVSGEKSVNGLPLLANDPHLQLGAPSQWYLVSLHSDNYNVTGAAIPGIPAIIIGNNESISWGITNGMVDQCDFYIETIDTSGRNQYLKNNNWQKIETRLEKININKRESFNLYVFETENGPIVSDFKNLKGFYEFQYQYLHLNEDSTIHGKQISMRWTGFEMSDEIYGINLINKAKERGHFEEGIKHIKTPGINFVYSDTKNNIGYYLAAKIPIRKSGNANLPQNGSSRESEWQGFVPDHLLPQIVNPPDKFIVTANNKIINNYPYVISNLWESPSRAERISEILKSKEKFSLDDFQKMQMDVVSPNARELTPIFLEALNKFQSSGNFYNQCLTYLRNWDYSISKESIPALLFNVIFYKILENTFQDEMGQDLFERYCFLAFLPTNTISKLLLDGKSIWFDNIQTANKIESRDDIIYQSYVEAIEFLKEKIGQDTKKWRWDELHKLTLSHPFGSQKPLDQIFNIGPLNTSGSNTTINCGYYDFNKPFENVVGPSMRYLIDMSNINESYCVIASGQSGQPFSSHYKDQINLLLDGKNVILYNSMEKVEKMNYRTFTIKPK